MSETDSLERQVCRVIVETLRLKRAPESIDVDAPLFGEGLGLDSVDALELVMGLEHAFGLRIEDQESGRRMLMSVRTIVAFLRERQAAP